MYGDERDQRPTMCGRKSGAKQGKRRRRRVKHKPYGSLGSGGVVNLPGEYDAKWRSTQCVGHSTNRRHKQAAIKRARREAEKKAERRKIKQSSHLASTSTENLSDKPGGVEW